MDKRWHVLTRVREVRTRQALNEVTRERRTQARAQANLEQARNVKAGFEQQAAQGMELLAAQSQPAAVGESTLDAAQAQAILNFVKASWLRARQAEAPIRRAQIQCDRAPTAGDEASSKYRQAASREEAVESRWETMQRTARRLQLEREDVEVAEDVSGVAVARRLREGAERREGHGGGGQGDGE